MSRMLAGQLGEALGISIDKCISLEIKLHAHEPIVVRAEYFSDADPDKVAEVFKGIMVFRDNG